MSGEDKLTGAILAAAENIEKAIDNELETLDSLNASELEKLRQDRLNALKKEREQKIEWKQMGHGVYSELPEERSFFDTVKQSDRSVVHFYQDSSERCKIVDMHLKLLAPAHLEARFVKINVNKCPFLTNNLKIRVLPTVLMVIKQQVIDRIIGFTDLGNRDDFSTKMMEWRLATSQVIEYDGDIRQRPDDTKKASFITKATKKTIREENSDLSSDEDL